MTLRIILSLGLALAAGACSGPDPETEMPAGAKSEVEPIEVVTPLQSNPLFAASTLYLQMPPFDRIRDEHYAPALERGMAEQRAEIEAIAGNPATPTFDNTLRALERSGRLLDRVSRVFFAMTSADTNDTLREVRRDMAPKLSAHADAIQLDRRLFQRIDALHQRRDTLELDAESLRLLEETHTRFVRGGARISDRDKATLEGINAELARVNTEFSQNVLREVNAKAVVVATTGELAGLSDHTIAAAADAAEVRGLAGHYLLALQNTSGQPVLSALENRALRRRIHEVSVSRGNSGGQYDNREELLEVVRLRGERARLLGYETHAAYQLEDQVARTAAAVNERLAALASPAAANARREAVDLQAMIDAEGDGFELEAWDWEFYAEKVRKRRYAFDEELLKPYLELNNVLVKGAFYAAERLYGLTFEERPDLPVYHPDVRVWEVFDADGTTLALFIADFYARPSKDGGAWMNAYVSGSRLLGTQPIVANHLNFLKPQAGEPTLLTWDEVTTLFHEFGHALHGMFSDVMYPSFAGTSVPRDFVEFPSQVNEMWADWPEVFANYAVHHETGAAMPAEMLGKVLAAAEFNQGFATTEYLAAAILDQAWHQAMPAELPGPDELREFEVSVLEAAGVAIDTVPPRYYSTYFSHINGGYSAGYYSYIWSEVLDADTVHWFRENGGLRRENGDYFRKTLLSRGGAEDPMLLFRNFRGAEPDIRHLLDRRGLN